MSDRRSFLTQLGAALAGLGIAGSLAQSDEHTAKWQGHVRMHKEGTLREIPLERTIPSDLKGFEQMGYTEEEIMALAISTLIIHSQMSARMAVRHEQTPEAAQAAAQAACLNYKFKVPRRRRFERR